MQTIIVDMTPGFRMPTIYYSQGDVGTQFAIDLRSRFGDSFPTGTTVTIQATKPSGFGFSVAATSVTNGVATFTTTAEMTDEFGRFPAELKVTKTGLTLFTANFYMDGERNTHPEGTTDGSQETVIPELTQLVERVEDAASSVLDMTVVANTLPAGSDATYSYDEETNTATFGIPKGADGSLASGVLAPTYSSSSTYAVGDYVYYSGSLYRCTTAITTAEAWTSGHWTQVALAPEVSDLKSDIDVIVTDIIEPISLFNPFFVDDGHYIWMDGSLQDNADFATSDFIAVEPNTTYVGNFTNHCLFFDSTKTAIQDSFTNTVTTVTSPANGYYVRFDWRKTTVPTDDIYFIPQSADIPFDYKFKISDIVTIPESQKGLPRVATENLFDLSTYVVGEYVSATDGSFPSNAEFARSDYMPVTPNANYVGNYTNHVCWYTKDKTFISGTNQVYSSTAPATARFAVIDFKTAAISADNIMFVQANSLPTQYIPKEEPLYRIPSDKIIGIWESIWKDKNVLFYGDSITAQITGDSPTGWGKAIYDKLSLASIHGKGVGGQTFEWNNNTFQADANGNYVNRGTASDNCLGCFPSWQRISTMIPASICNSIDLVVIMGGTNDFDGVEEIEGGSNIDYVEPIWSSSNTTDSVWGSSNEYNGGDYDVTTFCGAVASTIMKMQKRCPNAIIVLASPLSRSNLTTHAPTVKNGKTTQDLAETMCKVAKYMSVPFFDITTKCAINAWNQATYYQDAVHPNTAGGKMLARTMISEMINLYPKF